MFYDKNSEELWNAFFLEQKKRVKPCVVHISFSTVLLQQKKKKGRKIIQVFFSRREAAR